MSINKRRLKGDVIPVVLRDKYQNLGIRAHPDMSVGKCLMGLFYPWQNEFLTTWLYIVFAVYFWVELILIMAMSHKEYNFNNITDYYWMFIATLGIALSLTFTAIYLTFYPLSEKKREFFESFNY